MEKSISFAFRRTPWLAEFGGMTNNWNSDHHRHKWQGIRIKEIMIVRQRRSPIACNVTFRRTAWLLLLCMAAMLSPPVALSEDASPEKAASRSPWLLLPIFSSNPKLGTSLGALGAYIHYFDEESQASMFGVTAQYTSTGSTVGGAFAKTSFGADRHRLIAFVGGGRIKNDYEDFLGTGIPLKTEDNLSAVATRYLYRVKNDWFVGLQGLYTNYLIVGQTALDDQILNVLGLTGFRSGGGGAVLMHDSRDNDNSPTKGWVMNLNNIAYREWLGGSQDFDVYRLDLKGYREHGKGNVFAVRQNNQWTAGAPPSAYPPVSLRGYKSGQYLGKYMSSFEVEERFRIAQRWTATVYAGVACLYGSGKKCTESANLYPALGAGIQYVLKPEEGMVANLEYAKGEGDNSGIYLKLGYGF